MKQDASYKAATEYIQNHAAIREKVGEEIRFGFFPTGGISYSNGQGEAEFTIKVIGDKDTISTTIALHKQKNSDWEVDSVDYE